MLKQKGQHMPDATNLTIELCAETEKFRAMRNEWNCLLKESRADNVFLTWEWLFTWWEIYAGKTELYIIAIRDQKSELVGLAPLKVRARKVFGLRRGNVLEFIGTGRDVTSEYLDIIVKRGLETTVTKHIIRYVVEQNPRINWDLKHLREESPLLQVLSEFINAKMPLHFLKQWSICPTVTLPKSWEEFCAHKSSNFNKMMKQYLRVSHRDLNLQLVCCNSASELDNDLNQLIALHHNRWKGRSRAFKTNEYIQFHRRIASIFFENGWLRLFFLKSGCSLLAGIYCFKYGETLYYYQSGRNVEFSRHHLGTVLLNRVIMQGIKEGLTQFDLLTGNEPYKFRWADSINTTLRCRWSWVYNKSLN
jgi:CelD/BcsL family acetyltransferase involved in cellulose biosynthesis